MIQVFGALGTEVHVDGRRYEIVVLADGVTTWRGKCEACHIPIFVELQPGQVPKRRRCQAHLGGYKVKKDPAVETPQDEADKVQARFGTGAMAVEQMLPKVYDPAAPEMIAWSEPGDHIDRSVAHVEPTTPVNSILPSYTETTPTTVIPAADRYIPVKAPVVGEDAADPDRYDVRSLYAELAELEDREEVLSPDEVPLSRIWQPRLQLWAEQRMWMPDWGPRPGQEGCEVPAEFLPRARRR